MLIGILIGLVLGVGGTILIGMVVIAMMSLRIWPFDK